MKLYRWSFRKTSYAAFADTEAEARNFVVDAIRSTWSSSPQYAEHQLKEFTHMKTKVYEITAGAISIGDLAVP